MPAASRGERRGAAKPRTKLPPTRARTRAANSGPRTLSKWRTAHKTGWPRVALAAGGVMMIALASVVFVSSSGLAGPIVATTRAAGGRIVATTREAFDSRFASLGLRVDVVHLQGASAAAQDEILKAAALKTGTPILGVDLDAVRARVEAVGWVERARVIRLFPDTLVVAVDERPLLAVWQHAGRSVVVASDGTVVGAVDPGQFPRLPLIVGEGANVAARDLLPELTKRPNLAARVDAVVRVDRRRWDLRLKDGGVVELPAKDQAAALRTLDDLDRKGRILGLGLARIDLRDPHMVVVRPRGGAAPVTTARGV